MDTPDDLLRADLDRLKERIYPEEGIPMFLACENLVSHRATTQHVPVPATALNRNLASSFRRHAEVLERIRPHPSVKDFANIVELLAVGFFENNGDDKQTPPNSSSLSQRAASLQELYRIAPIIRAVNFHNTSRDRAEQYDRELAHYSRFFSSVSEDELDEYVTNGRWHKSKPGLIVAVYEGYRNGYDVLAPLLERHGFIGWFFVVTGFLNTSVKDQLLFAETHRIRMHTREYSDGRYALAWDELRELDRKHVIASHTRSHAELSLLDEATLEREVVGAHEDLQQQLGHKVRSFSSRTGPASGEDPRTDRWVAAAGYDFIFSNLRIQRVRANDRA